MLHYAGSETPPPSPLPDFERGDRRAWVKFGRRCLAGGWRGARSGGFRGGRGRRRWREVELGCQEVRELRCLIRHLRRRWFGRRRLSDVFAGCELGHRRPAHGLAVAADERDPCFGEVEAVVDAAGTGVLAHHEVAAAGPAHLQRCGARHLLGVRPTYGNDGRIVR